MICQSNVALSCTLLQEEASIRKFAKEFLLKVHVYFWLLLAIVNM